MFDCSFSTTAGPHETYGRGKNTPSSLARLDSARNEAPSVSHALDMIQDGYLTVPCQDEVAVHAVDGIFVRRDGELGGRETLSYCRAAEDATGARRVPKGTCVGEDVGAYVDDGEELERVFDRRVVGEGGGWFDEG